MEEQVLVADIVHTAVREDGADMLAKLLADTERVVQFLHQIVLLWSELDEPCGEVAVLQLILYSIDGTCLTLKVY